MLAIIAAAAAVAAAPAPSAAGSPALKADTAPRFIFADARTPNLRDAPRCRGAGRLHTAYEPALLYREQDRDAGQLRRLIDLPEGQACLLGGVPARAAAIPGEAR